MQNGNFPRLPLLVPNRISASRNDVPELERPSEIGLKTIYRASFAIWRAQWTDGDKMGWPSGLKETQNLLL